MSAVTQAVLAALKEASASLSLVASATAITTVGAATIVCNKPTGTVDGDLMVAIVNCTHDRTWSGDTGWTEVLDQTLMPSLRVAWKVAASEGASYTFTMAGGGGREATAAIVTFRGAAYDTVGASVVVGTGTTAIAASAITSAGGIILAAFASVALQDTWTTPTGMSVLTGNINDAASDASLNVFSQVVSAGSTGTRSSTPSVSGTHGGIIVGIKAA